MPAVLGPVDPALDLAPLGDLHLATLDKTLFSMLTEELSDILFSLPHITNVILVGLETQVCILQTALDLLAVPDRKYTPYVLADATSATSRLEVPIAHDLLRQQGAIVTTTQSLSYMLIKDASLPWFKPYNQLLKDEKESSDAATAFLLGPRA